jgi:aryl-alcohol dehydrogenase-like predicted oxidoreductase
MTERELGRSGLKVSAVGLGCMGMSGYYDPQHSSDRRARAPLLVARCPRIRRPSS